MATKKPESPAPEPAALIQITAAETLYNAAAGACAIAGNTPNAKAAAQLCPSLAAGSIIWADIFADEKFGAGLFPAWIDAFLTTAVNGPQFSQAQYAQAANAAADNLSFWLTFAEAVEVAKRVVVDGVVVDGAGEADPALGG